jgi:outer membrane protein OmpA-like peptidoglycan-associated protein
MKGLWFFIFVLGLSFQSKAQQTQWAYSVRGVSSQYSKKEYSASQVLGRPSKLPATGPSTTAWSPLWPDNGNQWIEVGFKTSIQVSRIGIGENANPGAVTEIILYDESNNAHTVYLEPVPHKVFSKGRMWNIEIPKTDFKCIALKLVLNTAAVKGYNHIDAIGISSGTEEIKAEINLAGVEFNSEPMNLGRNINTVYGEVHPIVSPDGNSLFFTRKNYPENKGAEKRDDIYVSRKDESGKWQKAVNIGSPLNNFGHNFINAISPDGNMALVAGTYESHNSKDKLYMAFKDGDSWAKPEEIIIKEYYNKSKYNSFHITSDGKVIIMAVERDNSKGLKDLYVSFLHADGTWSKPKHTGNVINSAGDEVTPFIAPDGKTLYFSSNGFSGYGSNDIFVSKRLDDTWTNWSEPKNLGPKINSKDWDAYYTVDAKGEFAYFTSYRNSLGEGDIFSIKLEDFQKPEIVALIKGKVFDGSSGQPISSRIEYEISESDVNAGLARSSAETGDYQVVLPVGESYDVFASKEKYYSVTEYMDLRDLKEYKEINMDLYLYPVRKGEVIPLDNIFFEANSSKLKTESFVELNRVVSFLKNNPGVIIEIGGHTNNKCSSTYCKKLSQDRAKSVATYLTNQKVRKAQVKYKGYGKSKPIDTNDTEAGRANNQRVEFTILETGG